MNAASGLVDLRSDTVTRPTPEMLASMMAAKVGDDVYEEDPTVNELEAATAKLLGKEAGLFTPSGTMANQIAIYLHTSRGSSVIAEEDSHVYLYEAGAAAAQSGVQFDLIPFSEELSDSSIKSKYKPEWLHYASTSLVIVENSHNRGLGRAVTKETMDRVARTSKDLGLQTHCDGARLWNASVATGNSEASLVQSFDSVSVCFSKGLGAPVGSVLTGSKELILKARKIRKRWGGGMRQAGYLAAACLHGLHHHRPRMKDDHHRAKVFFDGLVRLMGQGVQIKPTPLPTFYTNLVYFEVSPDKADAFLQRLREQRVLMSHLGHGRIRAVTHLDIDDDGIELALVAIKTAASTLL
jgi:threonine aldolase